MMEQSGRKGEFAAILVIAAGMAACAGSPASPGSAAPPDQVLPSGHPVMEASSLEDATAAALPPETGVVQEVLVGGGYTYVRVLAGDREMWVAGPETPLEVGQKIGIAGAMSMGNFSSPTLQRSFEDLYFVGSFQATGPPPEADSAEAVDVLVGGGYTYVLARVGEKEFWLAGPQTPIETGDTVFWVNGMEMGEFHSSSLDRTFENIVFVGRYWVERD